MDEDGVIIVCSIFRDEITELISRGKIPWPVVRVNSMLHIYPSHLERRLNKELRMYSERNIMLLFGDCHPRMEQQTSETIIRVQGINCCEIILGSERYRQLRSEGAFMMMPEWLDRWDEVFYRHLGLSDRGLATKFMNDFHTDITYIDTGLREVPVQKLDVVSQHTGLPWKIEKCSLEHLAEAIVTTYNKLQHVAG